MKNLAFIAYSDERWLHYNLTYISLQSLYILLEEVYFSNLGVKGLNEEKHGPFVWLSIAVKAPDIGL